MKKALIFDLDGLMVDTETLCYNTWVQVGKEHGVDVPLEFYLPLIGGSRNVFEEVRKIYPEACALGEEVKLRRMPVMEKMLNEHPGSLNKPGLEELYIAARQKGYKIAVASSSSRDYVENHLNHLGFPFEADVIVGGDEVEIPKPNPDVFLKAMKHLGETPEHCMILEDSRNGILAAHAANIDVVFIQDMVPPDELMKQYMLCQKPTLKEVIELL
ncbi:MAG: HAD family phosphatase [Erysipelotrichaceae bacterium]|nr:HAD family phosphatase [Erysipelotrichaceae bacterium]